jgi:hypothetical protein
MVLSAGKSFVYFARNARTVTTDLLVWYSNTQNNFSPRATIFSLHTLVSPSSRNVNYDKKNNFLGRKFLSSFYLYKFRKYRFFVIPEYIIKHPVYFNTYWLVSIIVSVELYKILEIFLLHCQKSLE